jgi:hypothetical protein
MALRDILRPFRRILLFGLSTQLGSQPLTAQIRVNPTGVNVNVQAATTVFLTFGPLRNRVPAEAFWCGELMPAAPDLGLKCDPATLLGRLPARYDLSVVSGEAGFTDIMSIPPSVARRAYQAAQAGANAPFFYVRRFVSTVGGPDEYVFVTCRLTGGGARTPLALTDVRLAFEVDAPVLFLAVGASVSRFSAEIRYNGTGRLVGRWEVVRPGDELPEPSDLLTEATLPVEERGTQRRYSELERFNVFLPPMGRAVLRGPDPARLPTSVEGTYLVLLRIEASDEKEGDSSLAAVGVGQDVVHSGGVAGFPLPVLRYVVGSGGSELSSSRSAELRLLFPAEGAALEPNRAIEFAWTDVSGAATYQIEVEAVDGGRILAALVPPGLGIYRAPPWLAERASGRALRWRVSALDLTGAALRLSPWRTLGPRPGP